MFFPPLTALVAALSLLSTTLAHNIQLKAHSRECFHEQLHRDDKMTVTFQVGDREFGGSGNLDVDFYVSLLLRLPARKQSANIVGRSRSPVAATKCTYGPCRRATTLSMPKWTGNTFTASATSTGRRIARRLASMCMGLCMCRRAMRRVIHWKRKVCYQTTV
jgi:hypothetical protein